MTHQLWKTWNEAIHDIETSEENRRKNAELDAQITEMYASHPNLRLLRRCDAGAGLERVKRYRLHVYVQTKIWSTPLRAFGIFTSIP